MGKQFGVEYGKELISKRPGLHLEEASSCHCKVPLQRVMTPKPEGLVMEAIPDR